ncbi:MAG: DUF3880 domain-containing protein [Lachnospiraceae bacterium]
MNILFYEWGSYIYKDLLSAFQSQGIAYETFFYHLSNKNHEEAFEVHLREKLETGQFDAVFSVNYFPVVAEVCKGKNVSYISWSYDNPLNVMQIEDTLGYETNYVFLFDRMQAKKYQDKGFVNVYYLPLAVNADRLDRISLRKSDLEKYETEISFVGNLYPSALASYMAPMNEYQKGYLEGICNVQEKLYGYYLIDEMLTDDFMRSIDEQYHKVKPDTEFVLPKEALSFACAASVTRMERIRMLALLSAHHRVKLYSRENCDALKNVSYMGTCNYETEMPKIFKASKINLNITLKILQSGIPLRALDIMGCGGFLLSNYQPELAEYFENEKEVVLYDSLEDAYAKAQFYLKNDHLRQSIAENGYCKVRERFSYKRQLEEMFTKLQSRSSSFF